MYDTVLRTWEIYTSLSTPRSGVRVINLEDRIYVLGGYDNTERLKSVECFSVGPQGPTWHRVPDMNKGRSNFSACVLEGKIYVSGEICFSAFLMNIMGYTHNLEEN